jgi:dynein light intermediate chain 1
MGIPIVVFVNKSDQILALDKSRDHSGKIIDFIQQNLRRECIRYGAALVFTSAKYGHNVDVAYEYLVHRVYDYKLSAETQTHEKDKIFVPSGWDSSNLISELDYVDINQPYEEVFRNERAAASNVEEQ